MPVTMTTWPEMPQRISVGPHSYVVVKDQAELDRKSIERQIVGPQGHHDPVALRILVTEQQAPGQQRDTLLHEVLHALTEMTGLHNEWSEEKEEAVVRRLTPALLDVLRRNPDLVEFLVAP